MVRNRVLSFMSQFSGTRDSKPNSPTSSPPHDSSPSSHKPADATESAYHPPPRRASTPPSSALQEYGSSPVNGSPVNNLGHKRSSSRPLSMVQTYQPPLMDVNEDTIPELQPIFTFLNSHANKLYQEGYFLKLDDQNTLGKPNPDRTWTECFAQLVGTVLSLWDAAELDAAGEDGEVLPKFINLTDASIKMIESLPTRSNDEQPLQNILSISTAGRNRYLLHFNSHHSLIQWTAGIRLSMFEHSTLQEAYTGALIAGKAKSLNNINVIMDRSRFKVEEWVRVRFGAGVPWRRCWCVISPPDEKEYQKLQKEMKKRSPYDRSHIPLLKGDIKFYDTRKDGKKQKKARPIASISEAYSAYAIYPQAKSLIDASTLIKIEGNITIHSDPPSSTEGFVFVMPETHPAVSGFEMLLRFLFPTWDTFALYGRPGRLVASVLDPRSLMFAMPKHKRYGYLEILDVSGLILTDGSGTWSEREWRKRLKDLTGRRMNAVDDSSRGHSRANSRRSARLSLGQNPAGGSTKPRVNFATEDPSLRSSRSMSLTGSGPRNDSAPPATDRERAPSAMAGATRRHARNTSDPQIGGLEYPAQEVPQYDNNYMAGPAHFSPGPVQHILREEQRTPVDRGSSDDERSARNTPVRELEELRNLRTPEPVQAPPQFNHAPQSRPGQRAYHSPELRRENSRLSSTTLAQMAKAGGMSLPTDTPSEESFGRRSADHGAESGPVQHNKHDPTLASANLSRSPEVLNSSSNIPRISPGLPAPETRMSPKRSRSPLRQQAYNSAESIPTAPPTGQLPPTPEYRGPAVYNQPSSNRPPQPAQPQAYLNYRGVQPMSRPSPPGSIRSNRSNQGRSTPDSIGHPGQSRKVTPPGGPMPYIAAQQSPRSPPNQQPQRESLLIDTHPIHRKPLPQRTTSLQKRQEEEATPVSTSSAGSYGDNLIDQEAFAQVHPLNPQRTQTVVEKEIQRQDSSTSSHYDDAASTASPDYASTQRSESLHSVERPRAGVLKTVGGGEPPVPVKPKEFDIPDVDFGPTINYGASAIPRSKTPTGLPLATSAQRPYSPARKSPGLEAGHVRQESDDTLRRVAWQPGGSTAGIGGQGPSMSAEQFVQQKAAAASAPYNHSRTPSGNILTTGRSVTPTPTTMLGGQSPYELGAKHMRRSSADLLQRPSSQGAGAALGDISSHLSAREQEQVARMTGTPLISMATNRNQAQAGSGLVGAIQAREREKQQMKQGVQNQAVQHAITQRQQQQQQAQQMYHQQQAQQVYQQPMYMQHNGSQPMLYPNGIGGSNMNVQYGQPRTSPNSVYGMAPSPGAGPYPQQSYSVSNLRPGQGPSPQGYAGSPVPGQGPQGPYLPPHGRGMPGYQNATGPGQAF